MEDALVAAERPPGSSWRVKLGGLYLVTDDRYLDARGLARVRRALRAGVDLFQFRHKALPTDEARAIGEELRALCARLGTPFIVNDSADEAEALRADGVHLGRGDAPVCEARERLGESAVIGASCGADVERAACAEREGADYVAVGRFYASPTKPGGALQPLSLLDEARAGLSVPVFAIGGVTPENAGDLLRHGASGVAVVSAILGNEEPERVIEAFRAVLESNLT